MRTARTVGVAVGAVLVVVLIGLLAYKPQFGLLIPLVLLVSGRWRAILSAAATVALLITTARRKPWAARSGPALPRTPRPIRIG